MSKRWRRWQDIVCAGKTLSAPAAKASAPAAKVSAPATKVSAQAA